MIQGTDMKGQILEWNNGKGYRRGLLVSGKEQPQDLIRQGNIGNIVTLKETKLVGFID